MCQPNAVVRLVTLTFASRDRERENPDSSIVTKRERERARSYTVSIIHSAEAIRLALGGDVTVEQQDAIDSIRHEAATLLRLVPASS